MNLLYIKALHIIFVVTWFAGLFYIVRLFIYHVEAENEEENARAILQKQYKLMSKRLWYGITWPSAVLTIFFGGALLMGPQDFLFQPWMHIKLTFVAALIIYQLVTHRMFIQLQNDVIKYTSFKLRLWNEGATVLLFAIVFLVELQNNISWVWAVVGLIIFSALLMLAIRAYKKMRNKKNSN